MKNRHIALVNSYDFEGWKSLQIYGDYVRTGLINSLGKEAIYSLPEEQRSPSSKVAKYYWKYMHLRRAIKKGAAEGKLIHLLDHAYAHLIKERELNVVTVHDMTHFVVPDLPVKQLRRWEARMQSLKKATHLVAISQFVADQLTEILDIPASKITVAYNDVDLSRFDIKKRQTYQADKHGEDHLRILSVGSVAKKKNLGVLLKAIEILDDRGMRPKLIRAGNLLKNGSSDLKMMSERLHKKGLLVELGALSHSGVAEEMYKADVVSFPSLYEGFGLPIVEAQAVGVPVVIANSSCLPEVAGTGSLKHDVDCPISLANQLEKVSLNDSSVAESIEAGRVNIKRFNPGKHVDSLLSVYNQLS